LLHERTQFYDSSVISMETQRDSFIFVFGYVPPSKIEVLYDSLWNFSPFHYTVCDPFMEKVSYKNQFSDFDDWDRIIQVVL